MQDGALWIVGRSKELIIRSGFNVYPPEVEAVLNAHPDVTLSAVVGRAVPGNEEVVAFVQLRPGAATAAQDLADFAASRLAPTNGRRKSSCSTRCRPTPPARS